MHADELPIDEALVRDLLGAQFPEWRALPLRRTGVAGTDNAMYRLGESMVVRLPRVPSAATQLAKELRWLPTLATRLPLAIPVPLAAGEPEAALGYPLPWSIYGWIDGEIAAPARIKDPLQAAEDLAGFVIALQSINSDGAPVPGAHNFYRGEPLAARDGETRRNIALLLDEFDAGSLAAAWGQALAAPAWQGRPTWLHGDLIGGNLLARDGRLCAVIDFGGLGAGDPACDVMAAWTWVAPQARGAFRKQVGVDDATWLRSRGWALSWAVIALPYYARSNAALSAIARQTIDAVLAG